MVLLGGLNALFGPLLGAAAFTWLSDSLARATEYWRALLGVLILLIVLVFPMGIGGALARLRAPEGGGDDAAILAGRRTCARSSAASAPSTMSRSRSTAGELVALIGPNGAGKTTCFNLVNGQLVPDAGSVMLAGSRIDGVAAACRSRAAAWAARSRSRRRSRR